MTKLTLTDLIMGFLCLLIYLPFLVIGIAVFAVVEAIYTMQRNDKLSHAGPTASTAKAD